MLVRHALGASLVLFGAAGAGGCSSGGGGGPTAGTTSFLVRSLSVPDGSVWQINREIVFVFTEPVAFETVSANTINIRSSDDLPAAGVFRLQDERTVVFQPACPTREDLADAGLQPGGVTYVVRVAGLDSSTNTVRSTNGVALGVQQTRTFTTPASSVPSHVFRDTRAGPPLPLVRAAGSGAIHASYLELGGDPERRVYLELDAEGKPTLSIPDFRSPLNLYSDAATRIAVLIAFDQPVSPVGSNIAPTRLGLEYRDPAGGWRGLETRVQLEANCTEMGAWVRLEPLGVLPPASAIRAVVRAGFRDLVGDAVLQPQEGFAEVPTSAVEFTSLTPADALSDALHESFLFGGDDPLSFEDTRVSLDDPPAEWGGGALAAGFAFGGTGGPDGDFDWIVRTGELFFFDTLATPIVGGPGGSSTRTLNTVGGVVDVHNLLVEEGGEIRVQGPNPMRIHATGEVILRGRIDLSGFSARDVATLNTGNLVEVGGAGAAGGGKGGNSNDNNTGHTLRGGRGSGPFRQAGLGGEGGEMAFHPSGSKNARRPGGGGGGTFSKFAGPSQTFTTGASMRSSAGRDGNLASIGVISGRTPAAGGRPGQGPFLDASDTNDFFGTRAVLAGDQVVDLVRGELPTLWAGYGGGGGGNAGVIFPNPAWRFSSDEKGGGGGGGAGALHVKALGRIVFGARGEILANGGRGATGENVSVIDHVGGTGGAGSGGHVILESATGVDFTDGGAALDAAPRDVVLAAGVPLRSGPVEAVTPAARGDSNGGASGPGVIQIHVPDAVGAPGTDAGADIRVPSSALAAADPLDLVTSPPALRLIPSFSARSKARSRWIPIGAPDQRPDGTPGLVRFLFGGVETVGEDAGKIRTRGERVAELEPLVADDRLAVSRTARILADGFTLELRGAALDALRSGTSAGISNDVYLRTPALLTDCVLRLRVVETPAIARDFSIVSARYEEGADSRGDERLRLSVARELGRLDDFNAAGEAGTTGFQLLPRFFRVVTGGLENGLPDSAFVRLRFQAVGANAAGGPDEAHPLTDPAWTGDIALFNSLAPGALRFFRYEVEFDLDSQAVGVTRETRPIVLDFLKIPFVF